MNHPVTDAHAKRSPMWGKLMGITTVEWWSDGVWCEMEMEGWGRWEQSVLEKDGFPWVTFVYVSFVLINSVVFYFLLSSG